MYLNTIVDGRFNTFFFNVKAAQHLSKASLINHTELSEAKMSNRDESNTKSSQARPVLQKNDNWPFLCWKQIKQNSLDKKKKCW